MYYSSKIRTASKNVSNSKAAAESSFIKYHFELWNKRIRELKNKKSILRDIVQRQKNIVIKYFLKVSKT